MELYGARIGKWNNSMHGEKNSLDGKYKNGWKLIKIGVF